MIKYIGIFLLCSAVSAYGAFLSCNISLSAKARTEILSLIQHIENGIRYGSTPIREICPSFSSPVLKKAGFLGLLKNESISKRDIDECLYFLTENEKNKLYEMLCGLGKSHYSELEIKLLEAHKAFFDEMAEKTQKENKIRSLLYKKLGLIAAIITAIILL